MYRSFSREYLRSGSTHEVFPIHQSNIRLPVNFIARRGAPPGGRAQSWHSFMLKHWLVWYVWQTEKHTDSNESR